MKYLVLLAGCGLGDGSCIEEVILTYVALDKYGCDYTPVAEDVSIQSVNHLTEEMAEKRNILIEAVRIGRGRIKDIHEVDFAEYDAYKIYHNGKPIGSYSDADIITDDNMIDVCKDGKWGFVDLDGKEIIAPQYKDAKSFSNGLAAVSDGEKWGFIDSTGNLVIDYLFYGGDYFNTKGCSRRWR